MNLYGSDNHNKFFSTNNSSIDVDGKDGKYAFAAQGLVNAALSNGTLMTADNKSPEPHFDESFLLGKNSKNAVTHYSVITRYKGYTHIRCKLETGRTHQIRVHMAYIGHPVSGDKVYGVKNENCLLYTSDAADD